MGQDLFYPPNVGGWSGGRDWLSGRYVIARANFAAALVEGKLTPQSGRVELTPLIQQHRGGTADLTEASGFLEELLLGRRIHPASRARILISIQEKEMETDDRIRWLAASLLALPEAHLH
jgi:hypothetical protein